MIQNYLKVASRNIVKRKMYSFINAFGLSIGIAFCILIFLYIRDEKSFDQFHQNKASIYRIEAKRYNSWNPDPNEPYQQYAWLQAGLKQALKDEIPEVELATRFNSENKCVFRQGDKVFTEDITYVDADFFKMFSFKLLSGNADKLFLNTDEIVLTPKVVKKYFGDADPIGKIVQVDNQGEKSYTVTGVVEAPPANSSLDFSVLLPQQNRPYHDRMVAQWGNSNSPTFVQLVQDTDLSKFSRNLDKLLEKYMSDRFKKWRDEATTPIPADIKLLELKFTQLPGWHLKKEIGWHKVSDPSYSLILGGVALLILLIACINYVSLALTTSTSRKTEVGIRKVVGAQKNQLVWQFGLESLILAFISMFTGILLVFLFLPAFNQYTGKEITLTFTVFFQLLGVSTLLTFIVGAIAGSYPAIFLSSFRPALVLKGGFTSKLQAGFTKPLVVVQFALSAFLIISSVVMYRQMQYVTTKDLGYNQEQVIVVPTQTGWNSKADETVEQFRAKSLQEPSIISVAGTSSSFTEGYSRYGYKINGEQKDAYVYSVDSYYMSTLGIELIQGRNFDINRPSDKTGVIVNEALVRDMKWTDPLNEHLNWREDTVGIGSQVIGVVKDYHFLSLERDIDPMFISMDKESIGNLVNILIKVSPEDMPGTVEKIHKIWKEISPDKPFDYAFLDQNVAKQYESYQRWMSIMGLATGFAILISCLGLFGLAGINAVNKTKEIGIRKVMGAEIASIFVLLNRQYVWLSFLAFIIAAPASYYAMEKWLSSFKFKIEVGWELYAISMLAGLFVALATVSYHAIRVALVNPAETLKYE
ncbi:MAG: FtsX-like permease family protein [Cyclobacteriaceae bacterium]|nr:FtsX-like permease family protein [Cyclobacteriaceae bacterium]